MALGRAGVPVGSIAGIGLCNQRASALVWDADTGAILSQNDWVDDHDLDEEFAAAAKRAFGTAPGATAARSPEGGDGSSYRGYNIPVESPNHTTPLPPAVHLLAKIITALVYSCLSLALLIAFGVLVGGVHQPPAVWLSVALRLLAGSVPFIALGFLIGYRYGPNAAPAVANLIYLPLSFASGLWIPIEALPSAMRTAAHALPPYHLGQLALAAVGAGRGEPAWTHVLTLIGFTAIGLGLAWIAYRRDEDVTWG